MRPVVLEIDKRGNYTIVAAPKKVEIIVRRPKKKTFKKRIKTIAYQIKSFFSSL
jgi:hypothetical protein